MGRWWMQIITLYTAHVIHQFYSFMSFRHTLIIFFIHIVWWWKYSFSNVERAISILEVLIKPIIVGHLIRSVSSVSSSTIENLFLIEAAWCLMMIIIISIRQKVMVHITQLAELLREVTTPLFIAFIHFTNI